MKNVMQFFLPKRYVSGRIFMKIRSVVLHKAADRQTDRQTDKRRVKHKSLAELADDMLQLKESS